MKIGDEFHVAFQDREPEEVRQMATVRAAQLGYRLQTRKDNEAGVMRIKRIEQDLDSYKALPKGLTYEQLRGLLRDEYGLDADHVPWGAAIEPGEMLRSRAERVGNDPRRVIEVAVAHQRYAVELLEDQVIATCLKQGETLEGWKRAKLIAMME
jgi:hypothetical protein